ncbi:MAG: oxidoreductase [Bacilli bacterium]|nr:oxidoreductase [Bacilli bacterium]
MSAAEKIRLGFVGAGAIGQVHMTEFSKHPEVILAAVTDAYLPFAEKRAAEYGIARVHASAEDLFEDDQIDAVVIGIPNKWHAPLAVKALRAGKHVLIEKPMGINGDAAKEIIRAERESGKVVMVGHQMRFEWASLQIKEQAEQGAFGRIYHAKAGWLRRKGIPGWGSWFTRKSESGGGPLIDIGVHMLDLSLWLMGNPKPVTVFGSTYAEFGPKRQGLGRWGTPDWSGYFDVEDLATALIKMEDGTTLSLDVSWAVHMDTANSAFVHLIGSDGGASWGSGGGKLLTEKFNQAVDVELKKPDQDLGARFRLTRHFIESIREEKTPIISAQSGLTNNLILDAIYESSKTGHEVELDWSL